MKLGGTPRSRAEMKFAAQGTRCERCGTLGATDWGPGSGVDGRETIRGTCATCQHWRELTFAIDGVKLDDAHGDLQLGGSDPSDILEPGDLLDDFDRVSKTITLPPERIAESEWFPMLKKVERVLTALNELAKFLPANAEEIPSQLVASTEHANRCTRMWITRETARWSEVMASFEADTRRLLDADPLRARSTPRRGGLDANGLDEHERWYEHRLFPEQEPGARLDVVSAAAEGLDGCDRGLTVCSLEGVLLDGADFRGANFAKARLIDVWMRRASLDKVGFQQLRAFFNCRFDDACLDDAMLHFTTGTVISFERASLRRTVLDWTHFRYAIFRDADFAGATLTQARFACCDFRGASFAGDPPTFATEALFEGCDFRGASLASLALTQATLRACRFAGAWGVPASTLGWRVIDADFSAAGDGSDRGGAERLLAELGD